jgi:hypothetical protein
LALTLLLFSSIDASPTMDPTRAVSDADFVSKKSPYTTFRFIAPTT